MTLPRRTSFGRTAYASFEPSGLQTGLDVFSPKVSRVIDARSRSTTHRSEMPPWPPTSATRLPSGESAASL